MTDPDPDLYPNAGGTDPPSGVSRRRLLAGSAAATAATAGCAGLGGGTDRPTVYVFNTGDGTVSLVDPERREVVGTEAVGLSSSFPSNQYTPELTEAAGDPLWLNVGQGVRALAAGSLEELAAVGTGSGANWLEQTPDGRHLVVSAREPAHRQFRIDADPGSAAFGEVTGEIDRRPEGGRGDRSGPGPCDVTIHPDGEYAYVPDLFGDTIAVLDIEAFEIVRRVEVAPVADGPAAPWMGTAAWDGQRLLVEHNEGAAGTESVWDTTDPARPEQVARLTAEDGLGRGPLTSEIGPDSEVGYVFTPDSGDVTVVDLVAGEVTDRIDLGGRAFVGSWDPARESLYVPVQTDDEVAVIDHASGDIEARLSVGAAPYGATAASVRPDTGDGPLPVALARLGLLEPAETTYCIGDCACGHEL